MRFRLIVPIAGIALVTASCIGGPTPDGIPPNELSAKIHDSQRLAAGSC